MPIVLPPSCGLCATLGIRDDKPKTGAVKSPSRTTRAPKLARLTAEVTPDLELHDVAIQKTLPYYASIMKSADFIGTLG